MESHQESTGAVKVFRDTQVRGLLRPQDAIAWMREAVIAESKGQLAAPARLNAPIGEGNLVLTAGSFVERAYGYRVYDTLGLPESEQIVVAHDAHSGAIEAIAIGSEIGLRRTSALGGVAHDALAPNRPISVALIGAGRQGQGQLWALQAVRTITNVKVFSRTQDNRNATAQRLDSTYGFPVTAVGSAEEAVTDADVVIMATNSPSPVIQTEWLAENCYVATVGPKQGGHSEFDDDLLHKARIITTDSMNQLSTSELPIHSNKAEPTIVPLAQLIENPPSPEGLRVYLSVGLAGTEPYLLHRLAAQVVSK